MGCALCKVLLLSGKIIHRIFKASSSPKYSPNHHMSSYYTTIYTKMLTATIRPLACFYWHGGDSSSL
jgi:hypothetical protein